MIILNIIFFSYLVGSEYRGGFWVDGMGCINGKKKTERLHILDEQ